MTVDPFLPMSPVDTAEGGDLKTLTDAGSPRTNAVKIAACQLPYVHQDINRALAIILEYAARAESQGARLICLPECYLQGYVYVGENTEELAFDLSSPAFGRILQALAQLTATVVFGFIEREGTRLFNTAVVVESGVVLGRYRKAKLLAGESQFEAGSSFPIFDLYGVKFGINICNDLNFPECAQAVAEQDARLLLCPCNNMMRKSDAERWNRKHNEIRKRRALETGMCLISSDVTGEWNGRVSYGSTAAIEGNGSVVCQVDRMQPGLIIYELQVVPGDGDKRV